MALGLVIQGRVVEQAPAYVMPEGVAVRARAEGEARRRALNPHAQAALPRLRLVHAVDALWDAGKLRDEQVQAAREIEAYWHAWTGALFSGVAEYGERMAKGSAVAEPPGVRARAGRYRAWASWAEAQRVAGRGELSVLQVVLDLCVRGWSPWRLRQEYRMSDRGALDVCQIGLRHYAVLAGWVDDKARNAA